MKVLPVRFWKLGQRGEWEKSVDFLPLAKTSAGGTVRGWLPPQEDAI